jgi:parallel beta-helix repeat protein
MIVNNTVEKSNKEGIFVIESGRCNISRNKIHENIDGIVVATGIPIISYNTITKNKSNGVVTLLRS